MKKIPTEPVTKQLATIRDTLTQNLVERDDAVRLSLLAALAGEHLLLIGPPGTAKSLVARRLHQALDGASYFEKLLTRFTVPEELFGPYSIKGLEEDRYERKVEGYLPTASVAFLDEIFKANSAILNALLTLLNEREFDNGNKRTKTPLVSIIGASNELPEGAELEALYDRFLLRLHVGPVSREGFHEILTGGNAEELELPAGLQITEKLRREIATKAVDVKVPEDVVGLLEEMRKWLIGQEITVSDRRWRKIVGLLKTSAATCSRESVSIWDCWLLQHCTWNEPEQRESVFTWYAERVGASRAMDTSRITKRVVLWEKQLAAHEAEQSHARDEYGRLLYEDARGKTVLAPKGQLPRETENGEPLYLAPPEVSRDSYYNTDFKGRDNEGQGFTETQLDELYIKGSQQFSRWDQREKYLLRRSSRLRRRGDHRPKLEQRRFPKAEMQRLSKELRSESSRLDEHLTGVEQLLASAKQEIARHLWVDPGFAEPGVHHLSETVAAIQELAGRFARVSEAYASLPVEPEYLPTEEDSEAARSPQVGENTHDLDDDEEAA